jgi:ABC-type multidrug transport system fused ATPase/permease subunit
MSFRYHDALDANQRCVFAWLSAQQWFSLRLRVIGATVIFIITALLCSLRGSISPGLVGLAVSYALTLEECLSSWVMYWQGLENAMVAPERIHQYQVRKHP